MKHLSRRIPAAIVLLTLLLSSGPAWSQKSSVASLPVSTPELQGISSKAIVNFLDAVDKGKNELHSFVIVRHGKVVSKGWWKPYRSDLKHVMFSTSKSFTSIGVGLAIADGRLKLTDNVVSFFPTSLPDTLGTYMKELTVQDLLKMSVGMDTDPMARARASSDWVKAFFLSSIEHKPGTVFKYNNMATFMLSAIVQKATGQKLLDYLRPRLFEPLGITNVTWDETPGGYTFGAIGLRIQSEDMAKFGQMLLQKGKWNGKQLVPEAWIAEASSLQIANGNPAATQPGTSDWAQGYGYQFWRSKYNSYRTDGLGGQFIMVLPEKDAVIVLTCSATSTQEELNLVWDHLLPAMQDHPLPEDKAAQAELNRRLANLDVAKKGSFPANPELLKKISGKKLEFESNSLGLNSLVITMKNSDALVQIGRETDQYQFSAGLDDWKFNQTRLNTLNAGPRINQTLPIHLASKYSWTGPKQLELTSKFVEEVIGSEVWAISFDEGPELKANIEIKGTSPVKLTARLTN